MKTNESPLYQMLKDHPGEMYVSDQLIAVLMPNDQLLVLTGKFENISTEEANLKVQEALSKMSQD